MTLHFILTSNTFSYQYYLSILTAIKAHKVDKVKLWKTELVKSPYLDALRDKLEVINVDQPKFKALEGKAAHFIAAHTKDYLMYKVLQEEGGICLDLDTISIKDVSDLLGDKEMVIPSDYPADTSFHSPYNTAILIAKAGSDILRQALEEATERLSSDAFKWGDTGPLLISKIVKANIANVYTPEFRTLGGITCGPEMLLVYNQHDYKLEQNVRVLHLYAYAAGDMFKGINEKYVEEAKTPLSKLICSLLTPEERNPCPVVAFPKKKIAIWARSAWAFGQIYRAVAKYSKHQVDLFDWSVTYPPDTFDSYDVVHVPVIQAYKNFKKLYPKYKGKVAVSCHGKAELFNYNPVTGVRHATSEEEIDKGIIPKEMVDAINELGTMSCVSLELKKILEAQTTAKIFYTPVGIDPDVFHGDIISHLPMTVLCPATREDVGKSEHEYNVKRYEMVLELEKKLPHIKFEFLEKRVGMDEIAEFYKKGDVIICLSHSEGTNTVTCEAGAMGVMPLMTKVGIAPEVIKHLHNGVIIDCPKENIVEIAYTHLNYLCVQRAELTKRRKEFQRTVLETRTWDVLVKEWDMFHNEVAEQKVFVEIGSNCFETLTSLVNEGWKGVIVEPVKEYLDKLPKVPEIAYENVAIGEAGHPDVRDFYYLTEETVRKNKLPQWATGIGSFTNTHKDIVKNHWQDLLTAQPVPVISFQELLDKHNLKKIDYLKIDAEGFDCEILKQVNLDDVEKITFEHKHAPVEDVNTVLDRLHHHNFNVVFDGPNVHAAKSSMPTELRKQVSPLTPTPDKFTFHLISLVHLPQSVKYNSCAFTQKNLKLAKMLTKLGHTVYFYGSEGSDVADYVKSDNFHFIQTHTLSDIRKAWGDGDNRFEIGYDWTATDFRHDFNTEKTEATKKFYATCIEEIKKNSKPDHFLLLTMGTYHHPIADAVGLFLRCEPGIGYRGSHAKNFRAFESSYIQNFSYGSANPFQSINGSYYDRVIPNYFDPNDFEFSDEKEDYILYIGRIIKRKGIMTADLVSRALNIPLKIVGQGGIVLPNGTLEATTNTDISIPKGNWEYLGFADVPKRKKLMAKARATFVATEYLECFGGTHVESMISGTPPITTNFAVFPETIPDYLNGKVGFRCNTLDDFVKATIKAKDVDHKFIRQYAEKFLMDNVALEFDKWFRDLYAVWESTAIPGKKGWHRINK